MAKLVELIPQWHQEEVPVVVRFCGTTQQSSSTRELLTSLCRQILTLAGTSDEDEISDEIPEVNIFEMFLFILAMSVTAVFLTLRLKHEKKKNIL